MKKQMVKIEEFDNNVYKRFTILDTEDDIANTTLTGTVFYNFASDSLDTKIDASLSANYQNSRTALRQILISTLQPTKCTEITKLLSIKPNQFYI
jgi:hypothetical protein